MYSNRYKLILGLWIPSKTFRQPITQQNISWKDGLFPARTHTLCDNYNLCARTYTLESNTNNI